MKYPKDVFRRVLTALAVCLTAVSVQAQVGCIPEKPSFQTSVYDYANIFSPEQKVALERKLIDYSDSTSTQIVVASTTDLCGGDIAMTATEWAHKWGIGQKDKDNGVLILVSPNDRKIFIAPGYGLEGSLTDAMCKRIIETMILPQFKKGDYYAGINAGADGIFQVLTGQFKAEPKVQFGHGGSSLLVVLPIILFAVIMIVMAFRGGKGGSNDGRGGGNGRKFSTGDALLTGLLLGSMGRHSGGSFGGGSGGFGGGGFGGGFGGGGFGGGGAGGSW